LYQKRKRGELLKYSQKLPHLLLIHSNSMTKFYDTPKIFLNEIQFKYQSQLKKKERIKEKEKRKVKELYH